VDYYSWAQIHAPYDPLTDYPIPFSNLKKCIAEQNLQMLAGDILFVRSGFVNTYSKLDIPARESIASVDPPHFAGVEQSEAILEWIWNQQFAAVAGDAPSFEVWRISPPRIELIAATQREFHLHEVLLSGWGCPIGEMFDLEKLADECRKRGRWSFFVCSEPLNVKGGVASPPNAVAIM
jgi:Putative cyclase